MNEKQQIWISSDTHIFLMSAQNLIYRETGEKPTQDEVIMRALKLAYGKEQHAINE